MGDHAGRSWTASCTNRETGQGLNVREAMSRTDAGISNFPLRSARQNKEKHHAVEK